ncbi:DUF1236 domain-containing protein [Rhodopseudomonas palustris]|uniref:DUF1236 domain-containing protein n=1 Tax=Rhodopseudomonas palustris (strain BisB18) TaxID=316056 RepID=Q20YB8_RHOPB
MRNSIVGLAALAGVCAPLAAQAQSLTTGSASDGVVAADAGGGIAREQRSAFRAYIVRERVPDYSIQQRVTVGSVLPETGVIMYDVPQSFGATTHRYTVVNGETVLVEPRTRRVVQVID